jgi:hypothetical protein
MTDPRGTNSAPEQDTGIDDPYARPADAGAYVGNRPERQAETIPGGVGPDDVRIAAHSTQRQLGPDDSADPPDLREAGENE